MLDRYVGMAIITLSKLEKAMIANPNSLSLDQKIRANALERQLEAKGILLQFHPDLDMYEIACFICQRKVGVHSVVYLLEDYRSYCSRCWEFTEPFFLKKELLPLS